MVGLKKVKNNILVLNYFRIIPKVSRSPVLPKVALSSTRFKRLKHTVAEKEQMILDFGQTPLGTIQCSSCGMTYNPGQPADELTHSKLHRNLFSCLKLTVMSHF